MGFMSGVEKSIVQSLLLTRYYDSEFGVRLLDIIRSENHIDIHSRAVSIHPGIYAAQ